MQQISHLKLMSMGSLQACGFFMEQTLYDISIDVNKFLSAFSIKVDGQHIFVHLPECRVKTTR